MSYNHNNPSGFGFCEALRLGMFAAGGPNNSSIRPSQVGLTQALMDPANMPGRFQGVMQNGSIVSLKVPYIPRATEDDVSDSFNCNTGDRTQINDLLVDPNTFFQAELNFSISQEELEAYCSELSVIYDTFQTSDDSPFLNMSQSQVSNFPAFAHIFDQLASKMDAMRRKINRDLSARLLTYVGNNAATGNNTPFSIPLLNASDSSKREQGIQILKKHMRQNSIKGAPFVVGAGIVEDFNTSMLYGCCNSGGFAFPEAYQNEPYIFYADDILPALQGNPDFFAVLSPGEVQLIYVNSRIRQAASRAGILADTNSTSILDPATGLMYDLELSSVPCDDSGLRHGAIWTVRLRLRYDLVTTPAFAYQATDPLFGVTGIFPYIGTSV